MLKDMTRARRRTDLVRKFKQRVKKLRPEYDTKTKEAKSRLRDWKEDKDHMLIYKTTGTPCSCDSCSNHYDRKKDRKVVDETIQDEVEIWENRYDETFEEELEKYFPYETWEDYN